MCVFGARRVDGAEAARKHVPLSIGDVRLLRERPRSRGRVHGRAQLLPKTPGRALVARGGEADRLDAPEALERRGRERERVDQDGAAVRRHRVGIGLGASDSLVARDRPAPDAGNDLLDAVRDGPWFAHSGLS
jgi:hypothetical protein